MPDPGNPQALNRYSYALNNPVRYTDPTGHRAFWSGEVPTDSCTIYECVPNSQVPGLLQQRLEVAVNSYVDYLNFVSPVVIGAVIAGGPGSAVNPEITGPELKNEISSADNGMGELEARAKALQQLRPTAIDVQMTTTGIVRTMDAEGNIVDLVAHSSGKLSDAQMAALQGYEVAVPYNGIAKMDAEQRALQWATGSLFEVLTPLEVAASRTICAVCAAQIFAAGAIPVSPFNLP